MSINPLNHYSLENRGPTVYDEEALTALQLSARTAGKMNEVVQAFNDLEKSVPGIVADDVQTHIDGGAFDKQIDKNMGNLGKKVDNLLGSVKEGSTTMDAEVIDARMDDNGKVHTNVGASIREQVGVGSGAAKAIVMFPGNGYMKLDSYDTDTGTTRIVMSGTSMYIIDPFTGKRRTLTAAQIGQQLPGRCYSTTNPGEEPTLTIALPPYQGYLGVKLGEATPKLVLEAGEGDHHFKVPHDVAVLFYFYYGQVDGPAIWSGAPKSFSKYPTDEYLATLDDMVKGSIYLSAGAKVNFTRYGDNGGMVVDVDGLLRVRFPSHSKKFTDWESITGALDPEKVQIDGQHMTITLDRYDYYLVYNVKNQQLRIRTAALNLHPEDFILAQVGYDEIVAGALLDIHTRSKSTDTNTQQFRLNGEKAGAFIKHYHELPNKFGFIFFTDPHLCLGSNWEANAEQWLSTVKTAYATMPGAALVCGGDWLGNGDTPEQAIYKGHYIKGFMGANTMTEGNLETGNPRVFFNAIGNHDTNEQGRHNTEANLWTGMLSNDLTVKSWCNPMFQGPDGTTISTNFGLAAGEDVRLIMLNTRGENSTNSEFADQMAQLQNILRYNQETFESPVSYVFVMHTFYTNDDLAVSTFAGQVRQVCDYYNTHNQGTGRVLGIFCGHRHFDHVDDTGATPVIMTADYQHGGVPTFDSVLFDGTERKFHLYRFGTGEDRVVNAP